MVESDQRLDKIENACPMFCMKVEMVDAEKMVMGPCCCLGVLWCPGAVQGDKVKDPSLGPNSYRGDNKMRPMCGLVFARAPEIRLFSLNTLSQGTAVA